MVLLKQIKSFRLKKGLSSLSLLLLLNNCRAADGNGDSLEVMDLTFYLFGFCFLMNSIKSPILLER